MSDRNELAQIINSVAEYDPDGRDFISPAVAARAIIAAGYRKYGRAQLERAWDAGRDAFSQAVINDGAEPLNPYRSQP